MSERAPPPAPKSKRRRVFLAVAVLLLGALATGPRERFVERWLEPDLPEDLDAWLASREAGVPDLREGDGKGIVWADPVERTPTPVALVYVHGFSADRHEIEPVLSDVAAELGANVFFTRLTGHGRDGAAMAEATVEAWLDDVVEAVSIGERIGERVVLVGTSTGGTLATWAAARPESAGRVHGLALVSPYYRLKDPTARIFLYPWGSQVARLVVGRERCFEPENDRQARHWTPCYPTSVLRTLISFAEMVRTMDVSEIRVPTLVMYHPDDQIVEPDEILAVATRMTGTSPALHVVETTSDPTRHVLAGDIMSPASEEEVRGLLLTFVASVTPPAAVTEGARGQEEVH